MIPTPIDDFEDSGLCGGSHCQCGEMARELESEVEPERGTEPLPSHTLPDEELRLMEEKESGLLRWDPLLVQLL